MEVHGIDMAAGAYRISFEADGRTVRGLVPETLVAEWLGQTKRPGHGEVYDWIASHRSKIEQALTRMSEGKHNIRAPYDRLTLVEE